MKRAPNYKDLYTIVWYLPPKKGRQEVHDGPCVESFVISSLFFRATRMKLSGASPLRSLTDFTAVHSGSQKLSILVQILGICLHWDA